MRNRTANSKVRAGLSLRGSLLAATLLCAAAAMPALGQSVTVTGNVPFPVTRLYQNSQETLTLTVNSTIALQALQIAPAYADGDFSLQMNNCPLQYTFAGTVCTFTVSFSPRLPGWSSAPAPISRSAPLQIQYYDVLAEVPVTLTIPLTGTGQYAQPVASPGLITDLIGNDVTRPNGFGGDGAVAANAVFTTPSGLTTDVLGNIYIADTGNSVVRMYYQAGSFPWIAGGAALTAGNVYTIAGVAPAGGVTGAGPGVDGVVATSSPLNGPTGVAVDALGNLYIADNNNQAVRMVAAGTGIITTVAGTLNSAETPGTGFSGDLGPATAAQLYIPASVVVDGFGNIYIADSGNNAIRVVYEGGAPLAALIATEIPGTTAVVGDIYTLAGGPANAAAASNGDGALASAANLNDPTGVTVDAIGDVYIADGGNNAVRRVDTVSGNISSVYAGGDVPTNLSVDSSDAIYFTLQHSCNVMQYNPTLQAGFAAPVSTVVAGNGTCNPSGDNGASTMAGLAGALGVVVDGAGNLYVLEADGVRLVAATGTLFNFGAVNVGTTSAPATVLLTDDDIQPYGGIQYYDTYAEYFSFTYTYMIPFSYAPYAGSNPNISDCNGGYLGGYSPSLSPGASCGASFVFQPTADGGPITNGAQSPNGPTINFTGAGVGPLPTATLTGGPLMFNAIVNETTSMSQQLTLTNTSAVTLTLSQIYFGTTNFQETDTCGISTYATKPTVAPGKSCYINVTFATNTVGVTNDTIYVMDNASSGATPGTQTAAVSGTGLAPIGVLQSPAGTQIVYTVKFPLTTPGKVASLPITLTNEGTATLNINPTGFSITGDEPGRFMITNNTCGLTLAIGANCVITVSYTPLTYAYYTATLNVQDDSGGVRIYHSGGAPVYQWLVQTLTLTGSTGNPPIEANLTAANTIFPPIAVGSSETQTVAVTLKNAAVLNSIAITPGFAEYTLGAITGCVVDGATLNAAGTICNVPVTFTPVAPGIRNAPLAAIDVESTGNVPYAFGLSGTGLGAVAALTPGIITTVVGGADGEAFGITGADGPAKATAVGFTPGMALDAAGQIFVSDNENEVIWKTDTSGNIHIYAGSPFPPGGYIESLAGDGGTAIGAQLGYVGVIALDQKDGLYVAETDGFSDNPRIRYIDPSTGLITTAIGFVPPGNWASSTAFFFSTRIVVTVGGTKYLYVATTGGTTAASQPAWPTATGASVMDGTVVWQNQGVYFGGMGCAGQTDTYGDGCLALQAGVYGVSGMTLDPAGNVFFTDAQGALLRRVDAVTKVVTLVAGTGSPGYGGDGGQAAAAQIAATDLAFDTKGNLNFIDDYGHVVRTINMATGVISTLAGTAGTAPYQGNYCLGGAGYGGLATAASFNYASSLAIDAANNIYISDNYGCVVSRIDSGTGIIHVVAGVPNSYAFYRNPGYGDVGFGPYISDGDASAATLNQPNVIRLDGTANIFIASAFGGVRKVNVGQSVLNFTGSSYTNGGSSTQLDTVSAPQTATVTNAGNQGSVIFTVPFEQAPQWGIGTLNFIRDVSSPTGATDCYALVVLSIGNECPVSVDFAPQQGSGYLYDTNTVSDNAMPGLGFQPIQLIGEVNGTAPLVTLTPFLLSFSTPQGTPSVPQTLTLTNNDVNALAISSIVIGGSGGTAYTETDNCGTSLAATSSCAIVVTFNPPVVALGPPAMYVPPDVLYGQVVVTDGAGNSPQSSALTGTGTVGGASTTGPFPLNDTIYISDAVTLLPSTVLPLPDSITFTDTVTLVSSTVLPTIRETINVEDAVSGVTVATVFIPVLETIHTTDSDMFPMPVLIPVMETIHTSDTILTPVFINDLETIHTNDSSSVSVSTYADTTTLTAVATVVQSGNPFQLTATVKGIGTPTVPTGMVNFYDGSTLLGSAGVSGGIASYNTAALGVGAHSLIAVYLGDSNFPSATSATLSGTVTTQTVLTVTPQSTSRNFGVANPAFSYAITGFTGGDTVAVVSGAAALATTATLNSAAGSYPITAALGTLSAPSKYAFNFASGTLTVNGNASQTITFAVLPNLPFSTVKHGTLTAHSTSGLAIQYTVTGPATVLGDVMTLTGTGMVSVTANQAGNATFAPASSFTRTFTVTP